MPTLEVLLELGVALTVFVLAISLMGLREESRAKRLRRRDDVVGEP